MSRCKFCECELSQADIGAVCADCRDQYAPEAPAQAVLTADDALTAMAIVQHPEEHAIKRVRLLSCLAAVAVARVLEMALTNRRGVRLALARRRAELEHTVIDCANHAPEQAHAAIASGLVAREEAAYV